MKRKINARFVLLTVMSVILTLVLATLAYYELFKKEVLAYSTAYLLFRYDGVDHVNWWPTESPVISVNGNRYTCRGRLYIKAFGATFAATVNAVYTFDESDKSFSQVSVNISEPRSTGK